VYENGARDYSPGLGTFLSMDSYAGLATDPLSMNRFLYAEANPTTFIDPSGHCIQFALAGPVAAGSCVVIVVGGGVLGDALVAIGLGALLGISATGVAQAEPPKPYDWAYWDTVVNGPRPMGPPHPAPGPTASPASKPAPATNALDSLPLPNYPPPTPSYAKAPENAQDLRDGPYLTVDWRPDGPELPDPVDPRPSCAGLPRWVCVSGVSVTVLALVNDMFGPVLQKGPQTGKPVADPSSSGPVAKPAPPSGLEVPMPSPTPSASTSMSSHRLVAS
jgi:hypothetical protein